MVAVAAVAAAAGAMWMPETGRHCRLAGCRCLEEAENQIPQKPVAAAASQTGLGSYSSAVADPQSDFLVAAASLVAAAPWTEWLAVDALLWLAQPQTQQAGWLPVSCWTAAG